MAEVHLFVLRYFLHVDGKFILSDTLRFLCPVVKRIRCSCHKGKRCSKLRYSYVWSHQSYLGSPRAEIRTTTDLAFRFNYLVDIVRCHYISLLMCSMALCSVAKS